MVEGTEIQTNPFFGPHPLCELVSKADGVSHLTVRKNKSSPLKADYSETHCLLANQAQFNLFNFFRYPVLNERYKFLNDVSV